MSKYIIFFILYTTLYAHQTALSFIDIVENSPKSINVVYKKPLRDIKAEDLLIKYPKTCKKISKIDKVIENGYITKTYSLACGDIGLKDSRIWVEGLVESNKGVIINYKNSDFEVKSLLKSSKSFVEINDKATGFSLFIEYVNLGVIHILTGYDHLLFVLSLLLMASNLRVLLVAVSAFTLSHSITLAAAIFDLVNISVVFIEAMIALSIVFLARELVVDKKNSFTKKYLEYVSFIFGLLHGFGFSNVLKTIGIPQDDIALALFSFNLGIEFGQILFILFASIIIAILKKYFKRYELLFLKFIAYFIGGISSYWFIQRILLL